MKRIFFLCVALVPGCGFYTIDNECKAEPDEGREVEGTLVAIESTRSATELPPLASEDVIESEDGTRRARRKVPSTFDLTEATIALPFGGAQLSLRRPDAPGTYRFDELDVQLCEGGIGGAGCVDPHGTVDVAVSEPDALDLSIRVDDAPIDDGPALRGSVRLLFRRWQREVCRPVRSGSNSAFAVRY